MKYYKDCWRCDGTGYLMEIPPGEVCRRCGGTGQVSSNVPPHRNPPPPPPHSNDNAGRYDFSGNPFAKRPRQYDNTHECGECLGQGCKRCYDPLRLRQLGDTTFPLSPVTTGCVPPAIAKPVPYYR